MRFSYPLVVCDIGGTNARFARIEEPHAGLGPLVRLRTQDFPTFGDAFAALGEGVKTLIVSAAGPVENGVVEMTYAAWRIDARALAAQFRLSACLILNDFEAQAIALPHLRPEQVLQIAPGVFDAAKTQIVVGPGTGFGCCALAPSPGGLLPIPTQVGDASFGPSAPDEIDVFKSFMTDAVPVSVETFLCGSGLTRLDQAVRAHGGRLGEARPPAETLAAAQNGEAAARRAIALFWRLTARLTGDLRIIFLAAGGVTLAGGILPRLVDFLDVEEFWRVFAAKRTCGRLAAATPIRLLLDDGAPLAGLAALARDPRAYGIDYRMRLFADGGRKFSDD